MGSEGDVPSVPTESKMNNELIVNPTQNSILETGRLFARVDILGYKDIMENAGIETQRERIINFLVQAYFADKSQNYQPPPYQLSGDEIHIYPHEGHSEVYNFRSIVYFLSALIERSIDSFFGGVRPRGDLPSGRTKTEFLPSDRPLPLRGALSFGEIKVYKEFIVSGPYISPDNPIIVPMIVLGNSVIKSYKWERAQKWIGASIDPESLGQLIHFVHQQIKDLKMENYLVEWHIPTKDGPIKSLAINFVREGEENILWDITEKMEIKSERSEHKAKYTATRLFIEHVIKNKLFLPSRIYPPSLSPSQQRQ